MQQVPFQIKYCGKEDISQPIQYEPTGCTIYFQFILVINLYIFRADLLLIIRRHYSVYTASGTCHTFYADWLLAGSEWNSFRSCQHMTYTNCCIYRVIPPTDER